jgi:hypothetical protein
MLLLAVLVAQQLDLSWPELQGTSWSELPWIRSCGELGLGVAVRDGKRREGASIWDYIGGEESALHDVIKGTMNTR